MQQNLIDIDKVIASKSPRLQRALPRFIVRYLKRIIHQDEINEVLQKHGHKQGVDFIDEAIKVMQVTYSVKGIENLKPDGRYLFASNHPLGGLDGMILIHLLGKRYPEVKFPVNDLLMHITQLHNIFIPINKHGAQSSQNVKLMDATFASDAQVLYFPAGLCSRKQHGRIEDLEWKKSFIVKAIQHKRDIVPVFFSGRNSNFFYNLAKLRTFLGIKANIEMLYLVNEMFKQKGKSITVIIGEPIPYTTFDSSKSPAEWAKWVKAIVYGLGKQSSNKH
ncbi:MAG TPA: 1-acyl-sn-glycerol-3-phosphate acyltransferase [Tenuifilum sp.]|uniref:1-acyl-sn-glycerol-3-phosphate acyltransferase n=1 Tax=Tenuifilum sp. TaxID=2760880 RepID=UPI002C3E8C1B|nr:1-acyl-sn-glycerol-3-phosphate acyltransferase [Tenuifilum sp.]